MYFPVHAALLVVLGLVVPMTQAGDSHIVLKPVKNDPSLPVKMMVFIPGGAVPNSKYAETAAAIQANVKTAALWVVIPAVFNRLCIIECTTSLLCSPLHNSVEGALTQAVSQGWVRGNDKKDLYLAGHSLGGVCANTLMQAYSMPYAALMVFGSYVDEAGSKFSLTNYSVPVLTLNAELDGGLARPGKTSIWWRQYLGLAAQDAKSALLDKPVIILPGLNHSDFCPGFNVPGDLMAEVGQQQATSTIGKYVGAYMDVQLARSAPAAADVQVLQEGTAWTRSLLTPYIKAEDMTVNRSDTRLGEGSSEMCRRAQALLSGLPATQQGRLFVQDSFHVSSPNLEHCHTNYSLTGQGGLRVSTCSHTDYYPDVDNTGGIEASSQLACKLISYDRVAQQLKVPTLQLPCAAFNAQVVALAEGRAAPATRARYQAKGKKWCFLPDVPTLGSIGPVWVFSDKLALKKNATCMTVASPLLQTSVSGSIYPGNMYCKFLTPERVLDWMMTDSLKP